MDHRPSQKDWKDRLEKDRIHKIMTLPKSSMYIHTTRWWFQIFFFSPLFGDRGNDPIWVIFFNWAETNPGNFHPMKIGAFPPELFVSGLPGRPWIFTPRCRCWRHVTDGDQRNAFKGMLPKMLAVIGRSVKYDHSIGTLHIEWHH